MTEEQTNINDVPEIDWLSEEAAQLSTTTSGGERLPSMKFEEDIINEIKIDFSTPFANWQDTSDPKKIVTKALIPITHEGEKKILWLNKANPLYGQLIVSGRDGKTFFSIKQEGNKQATRYIMLDSGDKNIPTTSTTE
jgi:hypothetical protein